MNELFHDLNFLSISRLEPVYFIWDSQTVVKSGAPSQTIVELLIRCVLAIGCGGLYSAYQSGKVINFTYFKEHARLLPFGTSIMDFLMVAGVLLYGSG